MNAITRRGALKLGLFFMAAPAVTASATAGVADWRSKLVEAAREQIGVTTIYDPAYVRLSYPGGDVAPERGVCTDVIVRAYRRAFGLDLQKLVHEDMAANFAAYPRTWGMKSTDRNIDHRRVGNLAAFFARHGEALPASDKPGDFQPGDIVTLMLPGNLPHIVIVSSGHSTEVPERPLVIHNIGWGAREDDALFAFKQTGRYRFAPA